MGAEEEAREKEWEEGGEGAINAPCFFAQLLLSSAPFLHVYIAKASLLTIFPCILQGAFFAWKATAMGKNYINGKTFLEKR